MPNPMPAARRRWQATLILSLFVVAVAAAAGVGWWYARESPPHQGPIVLISVDALQPRQLRAYGAARRDIPIIDTPAIDALAADGVLFTRAYAHSPQTLPAQASLLTGQLPFRHGVRNDIGYSLSDEARTVAGQLRNRGFETGGVVSSFLLRPESGMSQGFSFYDAELPQPDGPAEPPVVQRDGLATWSAAQEWMRGRAGQRYFLFIEVGRDAADAVVGRIVQHLKDRELYDGATIVLTAAHGDGTAGIRLDDRSLAIPLIVKQPDGEGAGRSVMMPVQQVDIAPTLLDFVRAPTPGDLQGQSLRPVLDNNEATLPARPGYAETLEALSRVGGAPVYAVTLDGYRLTRGATETVARVDESVPAAADDAAVADRLRAALDRLLEGTAIEPPADIAEADRAAYAALGYLPGLRAVAEAGGPADPEALARVVDAHRSAATLVASRQYTGAAAALRSIVRTYPELAVVQYQIGELLARAGRFADAITALAGAAGLRPEDPQIATALSATSLRARRLEDAMQHAGEAIALAEHAGDPRSLADAHEMAARIALAMRDGDAATLHADAAAQADRERPLPAFVRGRLAYDAGMYEEALAAYEEAARVARDGGRALRDLQLSMGETLAQLDRHAEAERAFQEELRAFPSNIGAYTSLAMLYRASNRDDEAANTVEALAIAAPTPEGYTTAARLWTMLGERARADALRAAARR
ncbi:MAG: sulfatase-like hydrolase/transferase [Vicinamibacterales bacterium]